MTPCLNALAPQIEALKTKPLIGVGTPGRLAELSRKGNLLSHKCPILILDEVEPLLQHCTKKRFVKGGSIEEGPISAGHAADHGTHWEEG